MPTKLTTPGILSTTLKLIGQPAESVQTLGPVLVCTYGKPEASKVAWRSLMALGYRACCSGNSVVVSGRDEGNPFSDQALFQLVTGQNQGIPNHLTYLNLIKRKSEELQMARTPSEQLDALIDLIYVTIGAGVALGYDMQGAWDEVQRSNMAKAQPDGTVLRSGDGKVLKPEGWTPPDLSPFISDLANLAFKGAVPGAHA